jgi:hypothetical protein
MAGKKKITSVRVRVPTFRYKTLRGLGRTKSKKNKKRGLLSGML